MAQLNLNNCQVSNSLSAKDVVVSNSLSFNNSNDNIGIGTESLAKNTTGYENTGLGAYSLAKNTDGYFNAGLGAYSLNANTSGYRNTGIGRTSLYFNTIGVRNTGVGTSSLFNNTEGSNNTGIGQQALLKNITGSNNTAIGSASLYNNTTGSNNTAIGNNALYNSNYSNVTGLGANSVVTGDNQVQLGDVSSNVYSQSAVNIRSDLRDKTDIRDTVLGLDFINKLRPVDFRWDMREDYVEYVVNEDTNDDSKSSITVIQKPKDGSKKRDRFHHGLIAQEVKSTMDNLNVDFAGYQDHKINGGKDVLTIGYEELIGPLIKSIQELTKQSNKSIQELKDEVAFLKSQLQK
jgi:hypothetical protein